MSTSLKKENSFGDKCKKHVKQNAKYLSDNHKKTNSQSTKPTGKTKKSTGALSNMAKTKNASKDKKSKRKRFNSPGAKKREPNSTKSRKKKSSKTPALKLQKPSGNMSGMPSGEIVKDLPMSGTFRPSACGTPSGQVVEDLSMAESYCLPAFGTPSGQLDNDLPMAGSYHPDQILDEIPSGGYFETIAEESDEEDEDDDEIIGTELTAFSSEIESLIDNKNSELKSSNASPVIMGNDLDTYIKVLIGDRKEILFKKIDSKFTKEIKSFIERVSNDLNTLKAVLNNWQGVMETKQEVHSYVRMFIEDIKTKIVNFKAELNKLLKERKRSIIMNYSELVDNLYVEQIMEGAFDKLIKNIIKVINLINNYFYGAPGPFIDKTLREAKLVINSYINDISPIQIDDKLGSLLNAFLEDVNNIKKSVAGCDHGDFKEMNSVMRDEVNRIFSYIPKLYDIKNKIANRLGLLPARPNVTLAWTKAIPRFSISKEIENRQKQVLIENDELFTGLNRIITMSEQLFYDNTIIIVHDYSKLGERMYGDVFRVQEKSTGRYLAVKTLKESNFRFIRDYFLERNYLIKARNSPYIMQFVDSMKFPLMKGLFLATEWYLCDISKLMKIMSEDIKDVDIAMALWKNTPNLILENIGRNSDRIGANLQNTIIVYIFEMFCALDYLAKVNILHLDIKLENIMIGQNLHIKITDIGLVYNMRLILNKAEIPEAAKINKAIQMGGSPAYNDPEMMLNGLMNIPKLFGFLFNNTA